MRWRPYDARRLTGRELRVEAAAAAQLHGRGAGDGAAGLPSRAPLDPLLAAALIVSLALASRVHLHLGAGFAVPTQLVLVPMLFLLPPEVVPAVRRPRPGRRRAARDAARSRAPRAHRHRHRRRLVRGRRRPRGRGGRRAAGGARVLGGAAARPARPVRDRPPVGHHPRVAGARHRPCRPDPRDRRRLRDRRLPDPGRLPRRHGGGRRAVRLRAHPAAARAAGRARRRPRRAHPRGRRPARPAHRGARAARPGDPPDRRGVRLQARPLRADRHRAAHGGRGARRRLRAGEPRRRAGHAGRASRPRSPPSRPARCGSPSTATTWRWPSR